ncbi:MAG: hypothetical protein AAF768_12400 [Pseudomonadota bacterium]
MKRTHNTFTAENPHSILVGDTANVLEGAPTSLPVVKTGSDTISARPHILAKRSSRWNRRAAH